jgi:competence protein CoiA
MESYTVDFDDELNEHLEIDNKTSRCLGLTEHTALRQEDNHIVYAGYVNKSDGPFYCPECLSDVVVRKCTEKVDHFAHHARQSPFDSQNKELHQNCQNKFLEYLKSTFPDGNWEAEREIPEKKDRGYKKVIPDLSGRINKIPVAIEIQSSSYTINKIFDKVSEYQNRNVAVLYVIPLYQDLGDEPFRPRLFEKYLHSLYYGRAYYWSLSLENKIQPVHFSPAKRYIEESTWFDVQSQTVVSEGGYWLTYRTVKKPNYGRILDIATDFEKIIRNSFEPKNSK